MLQTDAGRWTEAETSRETGRRISWLEQNNAARQISQIGGRGSGRGSERMPREPQRDASGEKEGGKEELEERGDGKRRQEKERHVEPVERVRRGSKSTGRRQKCCRRKPGCADRPLAAAPCCCEALLRGLHDKGKAECKRKNKSRGGSNGPRLFCFFRHAGD